MADRTPSPPVDSDVSATESEIRRDIERARNRYVDDEAEEDETRSVLAPVLRPPDPAEAKPDSLCS